MAGADSVLRPVVGQLPDGRVAQARYLTLTGDRAFTGGYSLGLFPPGVVKAEGPVGVASNPGIMLRHLPRAARFMALPRPPVRDIEDYDQKLNTIVASYLDHDVRSVAGTRRFTRLSPERRARLIRERYIGGRYLWALCAKIKHLVYLGAYGDQGADPAVGFVPWQQRPRYRDNAGSLEAMRAGNEN